MSPKSSYEMTAIQLWKAIQNGCATDQLIKNVDVICTQLNLPQALPFLLDTLENTLDSEISAKVLAEILFRYTHLSNEQKSRLLHRLSYHIYKANDHESSNTLSTIQRDLANSILATIRSSNYRNMVYMELITFIAENEQVDGNLRNQAIVFISGYALRHKD